MHTNYLGPNEGCAKFVADIECTASLEYAKKLSQDTGEKVTITHLLARALGLGLRDCRKAQGFIKWGNVISLSYFLYIHIHVYIVSLRKQIRS